MSFWHCEIILFFHYSIFCCYILQILRLNYFCWSMEHSFLNLLLNWFINSFLPNSLYVVGILLWESLYFICQVFIPGLYACFIKWFGWQSLFFIKKKKKLKVWKNSLVKSSFQNVFQRRFLDNSKCFTKFNLLLFSDLETILLHIIQEN